MLKLVKHCPMLALACTLLASCASLLGPREVELPLSKLQSGLDRRFPMNNPALELFEIELSRPQLSMLPDDGRVALSLDALAAPPFLHKSWRGTLTLSGRLYIDPQRSAVLMADPRVDRFAIDGVDDSRRLTKIANLLMNNVVADVPLYRFRPEDLRYGGVQLVPTRITTTARGLRVALEPAN
ncbi:MAG: DUF1439 domain-containing protein [Pseudomonadota bacterium]